MKKQTIIIIALLIFSILALNYFGILQITDNSYHTGIPPTDLNNMNTVHYWQDCWQGQAEPGYTELLSDTKFVTAYSSDNNLVLSERIAMDGNIYEDDIVEMSYPVKGWYVISIKTGLNNPWVDVVSKNWYDSTKVMINSGAVAPQELQYVGFGDWDEKQSARFNMLEIQFKGSVVGALRVSIVAEFTSGVPFTSNWDKTMSTDYAYLLSGKGAIWIEGYGPSDVPQFEIGETCPIHIEADYSGPTIGENGNWELWAFPHNGNPVIKIKTWSYDYFRETYNWVIPTGLWKQGASDNKVDLELRNTLFTTSKVKISSIDLKAKAPPTPTIQVTPTAPQVGETITVSMQANTNAQTNEIVTAFHLRAIYTDNNQEIVYVTSIVPTGQNPYLGSYSFTPQRAGPLKIQVWAHDKAGRESTTPATYTMEIHLGQFRLTVEALDYDTSLAIQGAKVTLYPGDSSKTTESDGKCWFDLEKNTYSVTVYKEGYRVETKTAFVDKDTSITVSLHRTTLIWNLKVIVADEDGNKIQWADVKVGGVAQARTDESGSWTFQNLPDGEYIVSASKGTQTGSKNIVLDSNKEITVVIKKPITEQVLSLNVILAIIVVIICAIVAFFIPIPGGTIGKILLIVAGIVAAVAIYLFL